MTSALVDHIQETAELVEKALASVLPSHDLAERSLFEAMRYACLGGGKRLRPFLVMESAKMFGVNPDCALRVGVAVELIHSYSLVHDDLPCMDNSSLRRGKPSVHKKFGETVAVLIGDALIPLAFEILTSPETHGDPLIRCTLTAALAKAIGYKGMVAGQMLDMLPGKENLDMGAITRLQRLKTGELISFCCESGAILGRASPVQRHALRTYAHDLGLAYQITDDLLDATGTEKETGKTVGQDAAAGKVTFVSILGIERAKAQANLLVQQAIGHLEIFEGRADTLRSLARFVAERKS